jgi:signal peptidase I
MQEPTPAAPHPSAAAPAGTPARGSWFRDLLEILLIALVLYAAITTCVEAVRVDGNSMLNTLQSGDFLIASKISDIVGNPQRGDIVIINPPHLCPGSPTADYVKRVVGLPGDRMEILPPTSVTAPTRLLIQPGGSGPWYQLDEPYLPGVWEQGPGIPAADGSDAVDHVLHIPAGRYFVMGDNRNDSCDSRVFGLVPRSDILATAILRIWPFTAFGGLGAGPTLTATVAPGGAGAALGIPLAWLPRRRRRLARQLAAAPLRRPL